MTQRKLEFNDQSATTSKDAAELNRLGAKLERLATQNRALRKAMLQFGENFDVKTWTNAFNSSDIDDINRVYTVTGGYLALVNNMAEAIRAGAKLTGTKPSEGTHGLPGIVEAVQADGGFTDQQAETFTELYRTRNHLQHASPDIQADEIHRHVQLLLGHLPRLVKSYLAWLKRHGVKL
ncbi:MAG TPA: hypothetical protein VK730_00590 [Solirubrobacteraceae bacterium]|jgi:hypothetical protein|nr:hypothetical protein [Solirubrobacteraceae bacterium]